MFIFLGILAKQEHFPFSPAPPKNISNFKIIRNQVCREKKLSKFKLGIVRYPPVNRADRYSRGTLTIELATGKSYYKTAQIIGLLDTVSTDVVIFLNITSGGCQFWLPILQSLSGQIKLKLKWRWLGGRGRAPPRKRRYLNLHVHVLRTKFSTY